MPAPLPARIANNDSRSGNVATMKTLRLLSIAALALAAGCKDKKSLCDKMKASRAIEPVAGLWAAHQDLVPPKGKVCGISKVSGPNALHVDFPDDDNPFVGLTQQLESKGLARKEQDISKPDIQSATFETTIDPSATHTTGYSVHAMLTRRDGVWFGTLALTAFCASGGHRTDGECQP